MIISIIRTLLLYCFIIFAIRLMGKRQISDMQPSELVVTLVISDIASLPMQNTSQPLLSGIIPVIVLVALEIVTSVFMMKSKRFRRMICGSPVVVISDGKLLQKEMRRLRLTTDDLFALLRQQNIFSPEDVQYCIVETNGTVSVLEKPEKRKPTAEDFKISIPDSKLEAMVISDGILIETALPLCSQSKDSVENVLKKEKLRQSDVLIMTLDGLGNYNIILKEK
ncbi:MAG: DUF421 domain-containing protein [Ruminococcus sp.]|nr:DUF421 domain-containing protein [Ruminococcus sp.]